MIKANSFSDGRGKKKSIGSLYGDLYGPYQDHEITIESFSVVPICKSQETNQTKDWISSSIGSFQAIRMRKKDVSAPLESYLTIAMPSKEDLVAIPLLIACLVCLVLSTASEHTAQALVPGLKLPVLVTMAQLVISALGSAIILALSDVLGYSKGAALDEIIWFCSSKRRMGNICAIALCDAIGFLAANLSLGLDNLAFHHCTFAAEPLFTSMVLLLIQGRRCSQSEFASILPILLGIYLCTRSSAGCSLAGFSFAAVSNLCFATRSVLASIVLQTTQPQPPGAGAGALDTRGAGRRIGSFQLFVLMSFGGSTVMTCIYFTTELHSAWRAALYTKEITGWSDRPVVIAALGGRRGGWGEVDEQDPARILGQLLVAGIFHLLYNAASFQVGLPASELLQRNGVWFGLSAMMRQSPAAASVSACASA